MGTSTQGWTVHFGGALAPFTARAEAKRFIKSDRKDVTVRTHDFTSEGHSNRVAHYILRKSEYVDDKRQLGLQ